MLWALSKAEKESTCNYLRNSIKFSEGIVRDTEKDLAELKSDNDLATRIWKVQLMRMHSAEKGQIPLLESRLEENDCNCDQS